MKSASKTKRQGANTDGVFPRWQSQQGEKPKFDLRSFVLDSWTNDVIVLFSPGGSLSLYSTFYPGFWYRTRVAAGVCAAARARKLRTGFRRSTYLLRWRRYDKEKAYCVSPPPASYLPAKIDIFFLRDPWHGDSRLSVGELWAET